MIEAEVRVDGKVLGGCCVGKGDLKGKRGIWRQLKRIPGGK